MQVHKDWYQAFLVTVGSLLLLFGLRGLFVQQNLYSSKSGTIASALSFFGIAGFHLGTLALYFVAPVLVTHDANTRALMYSDEPPFPRFAMFWASTLLIQVIGLLWIGIKTWRKGTKMQLNSFLLISGALILLAAPFIYFPLVKPANTIVMISFSIFAINILRSGTDNILLNMKTQSRQLQCYSK